MKLVFLMLLFAPPLFWGYSGMSFIAPAVGKIH